MQTAKIIRAEKIFRDKRAAAEKSRRYEVRVAVYPNAHLAYGVETDAAADATIGALRDSLRYKVAVWHGETGSIAKVIDTKNDRVMGHTSTMRDGAAWRELADIQCRTLNKAQPTE